MNAIDCFCGAGGLSLGLKQANISVRVAFDSDPHAVATYNRNLGNHALERFAETTSAEELLSAADLSFGECDLVVGGPPCQGFSRQRRGSDTDARNNLIRRYWEFIEGIRPKFFLLENVPAIQGIRGRVYLDEFTKKAADAGYYTHITVLNAADFGVPQIRKRLIVVGEMVEGLSRFEFPQPTVLPAEYTTVRSAIGDLPEPDSALAIARKLSNHERDNISEQNRIRISYVPPGGGRAHIPEHLQLPCHRVSVEVSGHRNVFGRLPWDKPANTITTKCNSFTRGMFAHPSDNRNITMREAARLQGFPDDFHFVGNRVAVAHQVGNAIPPPLGRALGVAITRAVEGRTQHKKTCIL